eukprot:TRINITY_DN56508_c0_g1_i1.p1 TRINITY_DN56508_c0_g1~~TRINITY_DN56508_c0_g1_i1.p1  ORF type:complete len:579 (-),score=154.39 TRINITY_DN56508_c0_g1_i1:148-1884(-)
MSTVKATLSTTSVASSNPQTPREFGVGTKVFVKTNGEEFAGKVAFEGETSFASGQWLGIALDLALGKNSGTVKGVTYFTCEEKHGLFVRPSAVRRQPEAVGSDDPVSGKLVRAAHAVRAAHKLDALTGDGDASSEAPLDSPARSATASSPWSSPRGRQVAERRANQRLENVAALHAVETGRNDAATLAALRDELRAAQAEALAAKTQQRDLTAEIMAERDAARTELGEARAEKQLTLQSEMRHAVSAEAAELSRQRAIETAKREAAIAMAATSELAGDSRRLEDATETARKRAASSEATKGRLKMAVRNEMAAREELRAMEAETQQQKFSLEAVIQQAMRREQEHRAELEAAARELEEVRIAQQHEVRAAEEKHRLLTKTEEEAAEARVKEAKKTVELACARETLKSMEASQELYKINVLNNMKEANSSGAVRRSKSMGAPMDVPDLVPHVGVPAAAKMRGAKADERPKSRLRKISCGTMSTATPAGSGKSANSDEDGFEVAELPLHVLHRELHSPLARRENNAAVDESAGVWDQLSMWFSSALCTSRYSLTPQEVTHPSATPSPTESESSERTEKLS